VTEARVLECVTDGGNAAVVCVLRALLGIHPKASVSAAAPHHLSRQGCDVVSNKELGASESPCSYHRPAGHWQQPDWTICNLAVPPLPQQHSLQIQVLYFKTCAHIPMRRFDYDL